MRIEIQPGVRLFVDVDGEGLAFERGALRERPTAILVHGGPGADHTAWKPAMRPLTEVAQLVYYDHRRQGRSDARTPDEWTLDVWADDTSHSVWRDRPEIALAVIQGFVAEPGPSAR